MNVNHLNWQPVESKSNVKTPVARALLVVNNTCHLVTLGSTKGGDTEIEFLKIVYHFDHTYCTIPVDPFSVLPAMKQCNTDQDVFEYCLSLVRQSNAAFVIFQDFNTQSEKDGYLYGTHVFNPSRPMHPISFQHLVRYDISNELLSIVPPKPYSPQFGFNTQPFQVNMNPFKYQMPGEEASNEDGLSNITFIAEMLLGECPEEEFTISGSKKAVTLKIPSTVSLEPLTEIEDDILKHIKVSFDEGTTIIKYKL